MELIKETARPWQEITTKEKIIYLLKEKVDGKGVYIKNTHPAAQIYMNQFNADLTVLCHLPSGIEIRDRITFFSTLNRQVEIDMEVVSTPGDGAILVTPIVARIGQSYRQSDRFSVNPDLVYGRNFQFLKDENLSSKNRISFDIVFREFETKLRNAFPGLIIQSAGSTDTTAQSLLVERTGKTILVRDGLKAEGYSVTEEGFLDYKAELSAPGNLQKSINDFNRKKIRSLLCGAITDPRLPEGKNVIATACMFSPEADKFSPETWESLKAELVFIPERIASLNSMTVDKKQDVFDLSENGVSFLFDDELLLKNLPGKKILTFDLIFKHQPPVRIQGEVRHIHQDDNKMMVGLSFQGEGHSITGRSTMQRYTVYLNQIKKLLTGNAVGTEQNR